jgi:hypothetical protein
MKLIWFGHSAFRIELPAAVILIDPFLSGNPKFSGSAEQAAEGATHIVLTHGHDAGPKSSVTRVALSACGVPYASTGGQGSPEPGKLVLPPPGVVSKSAGSDRAPVTPGRSSSSQNSSEHDPDNSDTRACVLELSDIRGTGSQHAAVDWGRIRFGSASQW